MKRALLINFGRMGDLLQTSPLITYLKERHPGLEIGCIAASNFAEVLEGIPGIDHPHPIDLMKYMLPLSRGEIRENYDLYQGLLDEISRYNYDTIFNLTHNRLGAVLSGLLPGETLGLSMDWEGFISVDNPWLRQFYNTNINRGLNQFNLVDLYRLAGGFKAGEASAANSRLRFNLLDEARGWAEAALRRAGWKGGEKIIGIQTGASTASKQWGAENFNRAARELSKGYFLAFFGSEKEKPLVESSIRDIGAAVDFAGETSVMQLAALLKKCALLISNDTGTQHLAAAVDTPALSLTLGPALASETGPFGAGHIIVEADVECAPCNYHHPCVDYACHARIQPDLIIWLARTMADGGDLTAISKEFTTGVKISRTAFDTKGLWYLEPLAPGADKHQRRVNFAYREAWWELHNTNNNSDIGKASLFGKEIAKDEFEILRSLESLIDISERGIMLAEALEREAAAEPVNIDKISELGAAIAQVDGEIEALGNSRIELRPLTLNFHLGKEALPDADLKKLAGLTAELYRTLKKGALLFGKHFAGDDGVERDEPEPATLILKRESRKVLAVDTPYFVTGELTRAFEECGAEVRLVGLSSQAKHTPGGAEEFVGKLLKEVDSFKPDFVFTVNHLGFDAEGYLAGELEHRGTPSAVYYVDSPLLILGEPHRLASGICALFCWDEYFIETMKAFGFSRAEYLPLAADIMHFYPRDKRSILGEYQPPICYAADSLTSDIGKFSAALTPGMLSSRVGEYIDSIRGGAGKDIYRALEAASNEFQFSDAEQRRAFKAAWMKKMFQKDRMKPLEELTELGLVIFGDEGWAGFFNGSKPALRGNLSYFDQLPLLYAGAGIGFNITSLQMPGGLNQRVFDIPASGGFLLTDYRPALEEVFDINNDIAVYNSLEEMKELAEYYLKRPEAREKMSLAARAEIVKNHTYRHRAATILERMSNHHHISVHPQSGTAEAVEIPPGEAYRESEILSGISRLKDELPDSLDVPEEVSIHHFGAKSLVIAPERASWIVTDAIGADIAKKLSAGASMGEAAAFAAIEHKLDGETALRKLREVIELMNAAKFRQVSETRFEDRDLHPRSLQLFITRSCNLRCRHCYFSAGEKMKRELAGAEWVAIIRRFALMGQGSVVTLTGGEPLMHPDFFEIAGAAAEEGLKAVLLTNGLLIKDIGTARRLADIVDSVQVSIDGVSPEVNDRIRGEGSFAGAAKAVGLLLEEKVDVEITCVALSENVADLERNLADFIESFDSTRLKCALAVANPIGRLKGDYREEPESLVGRVISSVGNVHWLRTGGYIPGCRTFGCGLATSIVVNPEGKIGSCPYLNYSGPGSVQGGDLAVLAQKDRDWHRQAMLKSEKCRDCDLKNFQCGSCRIFGKCTDQVKLRSYYRMIEGK